MVQVHDEAGGGGGGDSYVISNRLELKSSWGGGGSGGRRLGPGGEIVVLEAPVEGVGDEGDDWLVFRSVFLPTAMGSRQRRRITEWALKVVFFEL